MQTGRHAVHRAFVSSTFEDLQQHRAHVIAGLRKAGIAVDPMEDWTAATHEPKEFSRARLEGCDLCVLLVARRRGHIPAGETKSITQLEYEAARATGIDALVFLLDDEAPWYAQYDDRHGDPEVAEWRNQLGEHRGVGFFGLDPTSVEIAPAIARWLQERTIRPGSATSALEVLETDEGTIYRVTTGSGDQVDLARSRIAEPYRSPDFASFPTPLGAVPIDDLYVLPQAKIASWLESAADPSGLEEAQLQSPLDAAASHRRIVVVGPPGIGKTSFARFLTLELLSSGTELPLFVPLGEYAASGGSDLLAFALDRIAPYLAEGELGALRELALLLDRRDELVYVLDGLDEVPTSSRAALLRDVRRLRRFVLTSRPIGRIEVNQDVNGTLELLPFDDRDLGRFVRNWEECGLASGFSAGGLLRYLEADVQLTDLARIPQLAMILCWLWGEGGVYRFRTRAELLTEAIDRLLDRAVAALGLAQADQATLRRQAHWSHAELACHLQLGAADATYRVSQDDVIAHVERHAAPDTGASRVLQVLLTAGLLVPTDGRAVAFRFLHPLFQEFLAAEWLLHCDDFEEQLARILMRRSADEVLRLATALAQDSSQVRPIVEQLTAPANSDLFGMSWLQAAECLAEVADPRKHLGPDLDLLEETLLQASSQWWARDRFAGAMGRLHSPTMRDRLLAALDDDDAHMRWAAAEALVVMADPVTSEVIAERFVAEPWVPVRGALARALGAMRAEAHVTTLVDALGDVAVADLLASHVGEALGRIGDVGAFAALADLLDNQDLTSAVAFAVLGGIPHLPPEAAEAVERIFADHGFAVAFTPADTFVDPGESVEELAELLDADEAQARADAVRRLARHPDAEALWYVMVALSDPEPVVRDTAASALRNMSDEGDLIIDVVGASVSELVAGEPDDRALAGEVLVGLWLAADTHDEIVARPAALREALAGVATAGDLIAAIGHDAPAVDAAAAWLLGVLGDPGDAVHLVPHLAHESRDVRSAAAWSLGVLGDGAAGDGLLARLESEQDPQVLATMLRGLGVRRDERVLPAGVRLLATDHAEVTLAAVESLGALGQPAAVEALMAVPLEDDEVAEAVTRALGSIGDPAAVPFIRERLDSSAGAVVVAAAEALGDIGADAAVPALLACLGRDDVEIRRAAAASLGALGSDLATAGLAASMRSDPVEAVRREAAEALGRIAHRPTLVELVETIGDELDQRLVVTAAAQALLASTDEEFRAELIGLLEDREMAVQLAAADGLVEIAYGNRRHQLRSGTDLDEDAVEERVRVLTSRLAEGDGVERWAAVVRLGDLGTVDGVPPLFLSLADADFWTAAAAADALDALHDDEALTDQVEAAARDTAIRLREAGRAREFLQCFVDDPALAEEQELARNWALAHTDLLCDLLAVGGPDPTVFLGALWQIATRHHVRLMADGTVVLPSGERLPCEDAVARLGG